MLADLRPQSQRLARPRKRNIKTVSPRKQKVDTATLAASMQLQEQQREFAYSVIALIMKLGVLVVVVSSITKLGLASHKRLTSYVGLASALDIESQQLKKVQKRFDRLFTIGGHRRLMDEQDQWIAPNRIRIVWK